MKFIARLLLANLISSAAVFAQPKGTAESWLTTADQSALFAHQQPVSFTANSAAQAAVITVDDTHTYQTIDGFGFTLTGGSAQLLMQMSASRRRQLLRELFTTNGNNIGISYLRLTIGASDMNAFVYTYDDLPAGQTDLPLARFDFGPDKKDVIPVLREILKINPDIKLLATPWTAPVWMKTTHDTRGGSLIPKYQEVYARYLVKYIQGMKSQGISVDAITVQNEPLHAGNNPSMYMPAAEEGAFVKTYLGPAFKAADLSTKIIIYDHNADKPEYPLSILNDAEARPYIDGSAFHLYGGSITALAKVHAAYPDKNLYFTEQWMGAPANFNDFRQHIKDLTIGATRNWCRTVIEWNLAADPQSNPHTDRGGCDRCLGGITLNHDSVTRNPAYYVVAHSAKFVRPGSVRIESGYPETLPNVAFKTPDGKKVLIVLNDSAAAQTFAISYQGKQINAALSSQAVGTYIWK